MTRPQKQYDAIFKTIGNAKNANAARANTPGGGGRVSTTDISALPILGASEFGERREGGSAMSMKQELKHFLKELNSNNS